MTLRDTLPNGVRRLLRLPPSYARRMHDLDDEIRFHFDAHVARLVEGGMTEADAQTAALARFGDADDLRAYCGAIAARREPARRLWRWVDELGQDVHYAMRQIARSPVFTATAALILALGIGANTGVFSIVNHMLISPFPFADGNRMVVLLSTEGGGRISFNPESKLIAGWRARAHSVEDVVVFEEGAFALGDTARGQPQVVSGAAISPAMMSFVGMKPLLGRSILASDTLADAPPVAVIGADLWRREFAESPDVLNRTIVINDAPHTVIGVMPEQFVVPFTDARDVFVAMRRATNGRTAGIAKLRPGVTIGDANREVAALFPGKSELNALGEPPILKRAIDMVSRDRKQTILLLFGAVGIVLLIACANVANLLLTRSWGRQREFAVRVALGASRGRIVRQVLTESVLLAAIGGVMGVGFAFLVLKGVRVAIPGGAKDFNDVHIEQAVLLWSVAISAMTGVLFGVGPALAAARANASEALKASSRTSTGGRVSRRVRTSLVIGEVALSVVLLTGAGLLVRTLIALDRIDLGFASPGLSSMRLALPPKAAADSNTRYAAWLALRSGIEAIPGVRGTTLALAAPADFSISMGGLEVEGHPAVSGDSITTFAMNAVSPEYFSLTGIPLKQGRGFSPSAAISTKTSEDEIIVNEALARRLWPSTNPIGARVRRGYVHGVWSTVVGVVGDVRLPSQQNDRLNRDLQLYLRSASAPNSATLLVRADVPLGVLGPAITKAAHDANPGFKVTAAIATSDKTVASGMDRQRFVLRLIAAFALFAVVLAAVGLHSVIASAVNQRTPEIGVRVALGAQSGDVIGLVLAQGFRITLVGLVIGAGGALAATRVLRTFLYGVEPSDPLTLALVGVVLLGVAALAIYAPARRAARLDPIAALRAD